MAVIKLPNAGDSLTAKVVKCEVVESQASGQEQVKFTTEQGDIYIGRDTADRQLLRCGFGEGEGTSASVWYGDVDGSYLTFYRTANKNPALRPYWNIKRSDGSDAAPVRGVAESPAKAQVAPVSTHAPATTVEVLEAKRDAVEFAYRRAWEVAQAVQGKTGTPESMQAGAATLLIAYRDQGVIGLFAPKPKEEAAAKPKQPVKKKAVQPDDDFDADTVTELDDNLPF